MDAPTQFQSANVSEIALEKESNVGNVNGIVGPFAGIVLSGGAQTEWTHQHGLGDGLFDLEVQTTPVSNILIPFALASDYDETSVQENFLLRYSKIPFTSLFAEGRGDQQNVAQYDRFSAKQNILNKTVFLQHTAFSSQLSDLRAGFSTSPWRVVSFTADYRHYGDESQYDNAKLVQPVATGYPAFIRSRDLLTDEAEATLVLHPSALFKTTLSYQYHTTDYGLNTRPFVQSTTIISPGGPLTAGQEESQIFSINATLTPFPRLFLSATFSYETSTLTTAADGSPAVVPYRGNIYSGFASGTYVLGQNTDLFAGYVFSEANYGQNNFAGGLPLGIQYQRHSAQAGLTRRFGKNVAAKLQYRFDYYDEPSSGGANNYTAQSVFGTLSFQFR
jgi:hypothetical protein